jgi:hypothetical protein
MIISLFDSLNAGYAAVCTRAMQDPDFRAKAVSDPAGAWKAVTGSDFPGGLKLKFVEPHEGASFALPIPGTSVGGLTDADMAAIAGGKGSTHSGNHIHCGYTCKTTSGSSHGGTSHGGSTDISGSVS